MSRRNLTIQLTEETIRQAKIIAAQRGTSISGLVSQQIEELVCEADRYTEARERAIHYLTHPPFRLGGKRPAREELHARKSVRR
ncbi:MAG TPA: DUF6364 family protein [Thermoanaerobaculia bacterium]|nr:DUF6364 family protein [Thermoanaerobaculia bacterium]